ncbi:hypothetical protein ABZ916_42215 [Streptomyces sp. NPDC046853]|uniref:hypothetical protein n=1 Tax=Streptomyces sp. NPDC046853 TaxID=3154920 RepID=UPI0034092D91
MDAGFDGLEASMRQVDRAVDAVGARVEVVHDEVVALSGQFRIAAAELSSVAHTVDRVEDSVRQLGRRFDEFTEQYAKDQARTLAEAELTRLTIDWHARFEQRRKTRALAHGLVHALTKDALERDVVDKDLVAACAQERMIMEPDFWLGPAMVSLAARHLDKAPQMRRARAQAYSLDQARSNLFFTLTCTRLGELQEAARWIDRYLQSLDPYALDEDFHVVLDAVACNELGAQAHAYTRQAMERWLDRVGLAQASTLTNQVAHHMGELGKKLPEKRFEELSRVCAEGWDELHRGWEWATIPEATLVHLHRAFPGEHDKEPAGHAASALDALIDRHDADEAALASRIRYLELVVEYGGDEKAAREEHAVQQAAAKPVDLRTLLVNAVFVPEAVRLGEEARLLALRAVWPQVLSASHAYVEHSRSLLPLEIDVTWGEWRRPLPADPNVPVPGKALVNELRGLIEESTRRQVESVRLNRGRLITAAVGSLASMITAFLVPRGTARVSVILLGVAAATWAIAEWRRVPVRKQELSREGRDNVRSGTAALGRALGQRTVFFTAWRESLDAAQGLEVWGERAWCGDAGALEKGAREDPGREGTKE